MTKAAGVFAGEVTPQAPAHNSPTSKRKGYHYFEYGEFQPSSGIGHSWTQNNIDPFFPHPFRNNEYNEFTASVIFSPVTQPNTLENSFLFTIQSQGDSFHMLVRTRPATINMFFSFQMSTMYPSETNAVGVANGTIEITTGNQGWLPAHWYWIAASYDFTNSLITYAIRNLTLGEESIETGTIVDLRPIAFNDQIEGASLCGWGTTGVLDTHFDGAMSQLVLHNKYIDLNDLGNRNKFCCINGVINIGERGENIFGEIPLVHNERGGFPEEANGTIFIGDLEDLTSPVQIVRDEPLPPLCDD